MTNLFITYDLYRQQQNYAAVEAAIKQLGTAVKLLQTVWYVKTNLTMQEAHTHVARTMDQNDRLLTVEASNAIGQNIPDGLWGIVRRNWPV